MGEAILAPQLQILSLSKTKIFIVAIKFQTLTLDSSRRIWCILYLVIPIFLRGVFVETEYLRAQLIHQNMGWGWKLRQLCYLWVHNLLRSNQMSLILSFNQSPFINETTLVLLLWSQDALWFLLLRDNILLISVGFKQRRWLWCGLLKNAGSAV